MASDKRWKPIRAGDKYCSPACGAGCTWVAYQDAKKAASDLAKTLGEHWRPFVWENCRWYYRAELKNAPMRCEVSARTYAFGGTEYTCWYGPDYIGKRKSAKAALSLILNTAYKQAREHKTIIELIEGGRS